VDWLEVSAGDLATLLLLTTTGVMETLPLTGRGMSLVLVIMSRRCRDGDGFEMD